MVILTSGSVVRFSPLKPGGINGDFDGSVERRDGGGARGGQGDLLEGGFSFSYQNHS